MPEDSPLHQSEIRLLTGDTPQKRRDELFKALADGSVKLLIGTHALIESPVKFKKSSTRYHRRTAPLLV